MQADRGQGCLCGVLRMASRWMETQKLRDFGRLRENNISMKEMPSHAFHKGNRERTKSQAAQALAGRSYYLKKKIFMRTFSFAKRDFVT